MCPSQKSGQAFPFISRPRDSQREVVPGAGEVGHGLGPAREQNGVECCPRTLQTAPPSCVCVVVVVGGEIESKIKPNSHTHTLTGSLETSPTCPTLFDS